MFIDWAQTGSTIVAAFLASAVEFIEALTMVLAVGIVRGWRGALLGSGIAVGVLLIVVAVLGPALARIPLDMVHVVVGALLLLFGLRWLRKAILRGAGAIDRHDEASIYAREQQTLLRMTGNTGSLDKVAFVVAFKSVILEGTEVVFIVLALASGGAGLLWPASIGALAALSVVVLLGLAVHRPLSRIPENTLKLVVGVLLSAFGTFWAGEGVGVIWPGQDGAIAGLAAGYLAVACITMILCRRWIGARVRSPTRVEP